MAVTLRKNGDEDMGNENSREHSMSAPSVAATNVSCADTQIATTDSEPMATHDEERPPTPEQLHKLREATNKLVNCGHGEPAAPAEPAEPTDAATHEHDSGDIDLGFPVTNTDLLDWFKGVENLPASEESWSEFDSDMRSVRSQEDAILESLTQKSANGQFVVVGRTGQFGIRSGVGSAFFRAHPKGSEAHARYMELQGHNANCPNDVQTAQCGQTVRQLRCRD